MATALAALALCALLAEFSAASFTDTAQNPQTVSAVADFLAPSAEASTIAKSQGGVPGYVRASGTYYVYAEVTDSGNPPSGVASVKADVSSITPGQSAAVLSANSYTVGGVSYNYRSAQLTAAASLSAGSKSYTLSLTDAAGNSRTQSFSVGVNNGPFAGSSFSTANTSGGTVGLAEKGDTITFAFNEPPDPGSIVSGWTGSAATTVSVSIADNGSDDILTVNGSAGTIGSVGLGGNYTTSGKTTVFGGSTMTLSGSTLTITLGAVSSGAATKETSKNAPEWTPSASVYDSAGNACSAAKVIGADVKQF